MDPYSKCRWCGAVIRWVSNLNGKKVSLDAQPTREGNLIVVNGTTMYRVTENFKRLHPYTPVYEAHFATCAGR